LQAKTQIELKNAVAGKRNGLLGTILVHAGLFSLLILISFSTPPPPESEEGILVNFGTDETGIGLVEPSPPAGEKVIAPPSDPVVKAPPPAVHEAKATPPAAKNVSKSKEEALITQNNEEETPVVKNVVPAAKKIDPDAEKKRLEKIEENRIIKEQKEAERIRIKEELAEKQRVADEQKRIAAEQAREADIMNRTKNALANSKNSGTTSTGEGIAGGPGNQGDINGSVDSKVRGHGSGLGTSGNGTGASGNGTDKGVSYSLGGRGFQSLPSPNYKLQVEGKVVVEVSVDREGKVVQAIPGTKGSTTLDESLLRVAKEAALNARFEVKNDAPAIQKGTITYNFILK
jgi:colicin import membrane protein